MATSSSSFYDGRTKSRAWWDALCRINPQWLIVALLSFAVAFVHFESSSLLGGDRTTHHDDGKPSSSLPDTTTPSSLPIPSAVGVEVKNILGLSPWKSFPGSFRLTPAFPDQASRYDMLTIMPETGDFDVIEITAQFPYARYFGVNLYDANEATDFASLADREMIPNAGSRNPFAVGEYNNETSIDNEHRYYTIWLASEKVASTSLFQEQTKANHHVNVLTYPEGISMLAYMNRVYRPNRGQNSLGGVPLPTVKALKLNETKAAQPPRLLPKLVPAIQYVKSKLDMFVFNSEFSANWSLMKRFAGERSVRFHRPSDAGLFPNAHMEYIVASLDQMYWNKVAVITMKKTPTVDDTFDGGKAFQKDVNVRYWSFCVGDLASTGTPDCLCDDEIHKNPDGSSVTIIIAPFYLQSKIARAGLKNRMAWGALTYKPVLIHRQMLAADNFEGRIGNMPAISRPPAVERWMGDYAPKGQIFGVNEFLARLEKGDFHVAFD